MKFLLSVVLCVSVGFSVGLPARDFNDDAEIVIVPKGQQGVPAKAEDSDEQFFKNSGFPFTQSSFGFNIGFSDSFADIFKRFHSRFNPWGPTDSKEDGDDAVAFPAFGLPIPEGGNTTHTVQVVDGHKVEINNTVYEKKGDFGNSVFKVRIINVRPLEEGEKVDVGTSASGSTQSPPPAKKPESTRESTEDEDEESNDINSKYQPESTTTSTLAQPNESTITPMNDESEDESTQTPVVDLEDEAQNTSTTTSSANNDDADSDNEGDNEKLSAEAPESSSSESESINDNYGNSNNGKSEFEFEFETRNRYNLETGVGAETAEALNTRKLEKLEYINKYQQPHPLQDEFSADTEDEHNDSSNGNNNINVDDNGEWSSVETHGVVAADNNIYANDIDLYAPESVPVDLSNDIAVNDMLADQGFVDPDAEVFDVNEFPGHNNFNKLHLYEPIKRK